ncbi:MAG: molybdopterin-binding protein [Proteobacteria bacterium]|nr:molybdopterin-binding protein [Pseudomonadota bacterium]
MTRLPALRTASAACLLLALALPAAAQDPHLRASEPAPAPIASPVAVPLDAATLAALPRQPVTARVHDAELACEGIPLMALLRASGAVPEGALRSAHLGRYVLVDARDGYRVLFSLAELDPGTGNREAWLVDRCAGAALDDKDGPLRLLVPGDTRAARSVRQVEAINVVVAP